MQINNYKVVEGNTAEEIAGEVRRALNAGWEVLGGIATRVEQRDDPNFKGEFYNVTTYSQAMVK
jgi:hypothetical protein